MKQLFYLGIIGLIIFEILNVYFIMPMPGSQQIRSIDLAYFLYTYRWIFRFTFGFLMLLGILQAYRSKKWLPILALLVVIGVCYAFNFQMAADSMFYQPSNLQMLEAKQNKIPKDRLILGVNINGEAKAYPISLIGYHHQVRDTLGGKPIMVTYCTVCRTGRVFEPLVNGKSEKFRLVGMDHFNAMFEDETTKSWWRQANGEAITGELKGTHLPELEAQQTSLATWLKLYPDSKIMQPDSKFKDNYDSTAKYESGKSKKELTGTDSLSWKRKSWVVGIEIGKESIAIDWNRLKKEKVVNIQLSQKPLVVVLANDNKSFFAFERPDEQMKFSLKNDSLISQKQRFDLKGTNTDLKISLKKVNAYQEFWHSWQTFHPNTHRY
ncbi:DUF3179 domain-containing (seleno)protein [Arcicella sp. LKC2W]|uniref:DUF3179 domain-containing (seleno)protein n=1 Tax=Arcicella sp. LKC2W TaxID=2984198 RepID=UPI002B1EEFC7|nr:DUF3179 domain-containing (seleno)protein [Arcicella sp. LKC2W]MEA5461853.1 DUF3179 domain-containing (seleno)protein [Arcicella sp. LKC2W]